MAEKTKQPSSQVVPVVSDGQIRAKSWNYTWNNYSAENVEYLKQLEGISYHVIGYEKAPTTGTPHIQGYITFKSTKTRKQVVSLLPDIFVEKTRNRKAMDAYCQKAGEFDVVDNRVRSKAGATARAVLALIKETGSLDRVEEEHPGYYIRHFSALERIAIRYADASRPRPVVLWFYGETGAGKSFQADVLGGKDAYWHSGLYRWWPLYQHHKTVILDDIRGDFCPLHTLLRLFDGYPLAVEVKGGHRLVKADKFIVTTATPPTMFYPSKSGNDGDVRQLLRRLTTVTQFFRELAPDGVVNYAQVDETELWGAGKYFR